MNEKNVGRTLEFLEKHRIALVMVDEPQGDEVLAAADGGGHLAQAGRRPLPRPANRRPGRRGASRSSSGSATSTTKRSWGSGWPRIQEAASDATELHLLMNNCYANYGTTNAREIAALLSAGRTYFGNVVLDDLVVRSYVSGATRRPRSKRGAHEAASLRKNLHLRASRVR